MLQGAVKRRTAALEWCPEEYRDLYDRIRSHKDISAAEAKQIVLDHIAIVQRRQAKAA